MSDKALSQATTYRWAKPIFAKAMRFEVVDELAGIVGLLLLSRFVPQLLDG